MQKDWTTEKGLTRDTGNVTCDCPIDSFKRRVFPAVFLLIFILGLVANSASLWVFVSMYRRRSLTTVNLYMVNLLVSDLMLVCSLPLRATYYLLESNWPFGDLTCRLVSYVFYINMYGSVYFLLALSVIRYLAVSHPYRYLSLEEGGFCGWGVCVVIWLFVFLTCAPILSTGTDQEAGRTRCLEVGLGLSIVLPLNYLALTVGFIMPFAVISVCYMCVILSLLQRRAGVEGMKRPSRRKSCALVVLGLCIFMVCFLPYHVVRTLFLEAEKHIQENGCHDSCSYILGMRKAAVVTLCLATGNSCLDPFLYFFVGENFKDFCMKIGGRQRMVVDNLGRQRPVVQELQPIE